MKKRKTRAAKPIINTFADSIASFEVMRIDKDFLERINTFADSIASFAKERLKEFNENQKTYLEERLKEFNENKKNFVDSLKCSFF